LNTQRTYTLVLVMLFAAFAQANAQQPALTQRAEAVSESIGYAGAIQVGQTVYISGMVARGETVEQQVAAIYAQLPQLLARFGATIQDVVKEVAYTTDMEALKAANPVRKKAYGSHAPAATWVQITRLFMESAKVEIEFIAVPGSGKR
jgi:2-iminobutanoate/2-iminopropanoate deaminase